jgi:hypothetical protein
VDVPGSIVELWMGRKRRGSGRRLDYSDEVIAVTPQSLNDVLPGAVIAYSLADHRQATRQRRLGDELTGPAGRQELVFRDRAVTLRQEMDEHRECLGLEGTHHTSPPQFPAFDVECVLAKDKDHGLASCSVIVPTPRASRSREEHQQRQSHPLLGYAGGSVLRGPRPSNARSR